MCFLARRQKRGVFAFTSVFERHLHPRSAASRRMSEISMVRVRSLRTRPSHRSAMTLLAAIDARKAGVVELRFFGGLLRMEEIAAVLNISIETVNRD